jgi:hypothetical protein
MNDNKVRLISGKQYLIVDCEYDDDFTGETCVYIGKASRKLIAVKIRKTIIYLRREDLTEPFAVE